LVYTVQLYFNAQCKKHTFTDYSQLSLIILS